MNILSIDWDYFFPDTSEYDWGHNENSIMLDFIWSTRCISRSLKDRTKRAIAEIEEKE